ncbi:hypothetical protein ACOXH8_04085 [Nannocystis pusilla]
MFSMTCPEGGRAPVVRLADDLDVRDPLEHPHQAATRRRLVVDHQHLHAWPAARTPNA